MAEYQIVELQEKKVIGLCARTSNSDPEMQKKIGGLWQNLFQSKVFFQIPHKVNAHSIGLYSDYEDDGYDVTAGCEVSSAEELPEGTVCKTIPGGKYAEFVIRGDDVDAVGKLWGEIWQMPLDRTYTGDFEEYFESSSDEASQASKAREIHLYIAVK